MKNALVTGGAGFIGIHLTQRLLDNGQNVFVIDNFCTGNKKNIEPFFGNKNFSFLEHDITKPLELEEKIAWVFNLASPASPKQYKRMPIETLLAGSLGVKNMLNFSLQKKAVFLQASTSEVYGNPLEHPQRETYFGNVNPVGERSCYDESKRFAEAITMAYSRKHKMQTRIVRIFNTFGPGMKEEDGRIISTFIPQALAGKPLTVFGTGKQTRSLCYVSDLVEGLVKAMESSYPLPINLGNPEEHTILEIAEKIISLTKSKSKIVFSALPSDDPEKRQPDISLAKKLLNWEPKVPFEKGLEKTIEWFQQKEI